MNTSLKEETTHHWPASLALNFNASARGTKLSRCRHNGPLYVQKPFYPEGADLAHVYLLHPPGGLVSGDTLGITVTAEENTKTLITTPGAARIYRARETRSRQKQSVDIVIGKNASVEWFPMETIVYDGADAELHTTIKLEENSHFIAWEITCLGLPASHKSFNKGSLLQTYRIEKNGCPLFIDRLQFSPEKSQWFHNQAGMRNNTSTGFFMAGPFGSSTDTAKKAQDNKANAVQSSSADFLEKLNNDLREKIASNDLEKKLAVTWVNDFCMIRYLGESAFEARDAFVLMWELLRPLLLERQANAPGIWKT